METNAYNVNMSFFQTLAEHIENKPPDLSSAVTVLEFLYECYSQCNNLDNAQIEADFDRLYEAMNGWKLKEMDRVTNPVCVICHDCERNGFINGVLIGVRLRDELQKLEYT